MLVSKGLIETIKKYQSHLNGCGFFIPKIGYLLVYTIKVISFQILLINCLSNLRLIAIQLI